MESCKCPITQELFEDPVIADDGHTYERKAITDWLQKNNTSPITRQTMDINTLRTNYIVKQMIEEIRNTIKSTQTQFQFQLDVDIRKTRQKAIFQGFGKTISEVEWINRDGPPIILLKIGGAKANREASFYVQLSCHPNIVKTFGFVQSNPDSIMLLQEYATHGDLSDLLQENGFKPNEKVLWNIFEQISDAMICLADNRIVHGDLACRNVLVFQYNTNDPHKNLVKLTDFGLTRGSQLYSVVDSPAMSTMTIIPTRYAAPEILRDPNKPIYSEKSDVYSMGVLMWEACSYGQLPYSSLTNDNHVRQRKLNDERLQQPSLCSDELWIIINDCWDPNPKNRLNFKTLKKSLLNIQNESSFDSHQPRNQRSNQRQDRSTIIDQCTQNNILHIPCEFCNEQIDSRRWSTHAQDCREKESRRVKARAEIRNREPVTENLPCEHCEELFPAEQFRTHEIICQKNPENLARAARLAKTKALVTVDLSNGSSKSERDSTLSSYYSSLQPSSSSTSAYKFSSQSRDIVDRINDRERNVTLEDRRFSSNLSVNTKQNPEILKFRDNDASTVAISVRQPVKQHRTSDDSGLRLINSSVDISTSNTLPLLLNNRFSSDTQSLPRRIDRASLERPLFDRQREERQSMPPRSKSPTNHSSRSQSASRSSRDARGSNRPNAIEGLNAHLIKDNVIFNSPRSEDQDHRPIINRRNRPTTNSNKPKSKSLLLQPPMRFGIKSVDMDFE